MIFRVRFTVAGGHVHCRLFSAKQPNMTWAKCGDFCVTKGQEFSDLMRAFGGVDFIGDDEKIGIIEASQP